MGVSVLKGSGIGETSEEHRHLGRISCAKAFKTGFINNLLNPKATLFFLSVFTQVVSPTTPGFMKISYAVFITTVCLSWFVLVAFFLTQNSVKARFNKVMSKLEKVMGLALVGFGVKVALTA